MADRRLKSVVIVGGGLEGWLAAAVMADRFHEFRHTRVTIVETPNRAESASVQSTTPHFRDLLRRFRIVEPDFIARTGATFKLASGFTGWAGEGSEFFDSFSDQGVALLGVPFQHFWVKLRRLGRAAPVDRYSLASELARAGKFALPHPDAAAGFSTFSYALNFDAELAAKYLKSWALMHGVKHVVAECVGAQLDAESGNIESVVLGDGRRVAGDFFLDCSGSRAVLMEAMRVGVDDWSEWLHCDRAVALACESRTPAFASTHATASEGGWRWRIPLQGRVAHGYVYCSRELSDDEALATLRAGTDGPVLAEPKLLAMRAGLRHQVWSGNVFGLGFAAGCLEPLHSAHLWLLQRCLQHLMDGFPQASANPVLRDDVNRRCRESWESIRDFTLLVYKLNGRAGQSFWDECRQRAIPDSLRETLELFRATGRLPRRDIEFLPSTSWLSMFSGLGMLPDYYHPQVDDLVEADLARELEKMQAAIARAVAGAPAVQSVSRRSG